jgi:hypothetical protein
MAGGEDKADGIVNGSAWGERVVVREEWRVASVEGDEEGGDNLEERAVTWAGRDDVSV